MLPRRLARGLLGLATVAAVAILVDRPAVADDHAQDTLRTLYRVAISAEMCGFAISNRQADDLGKAMDRSLSDSGLGEEAADELYRGVDAELTAEGWDKICAQNGDWARTYRAVIAANSK